MGKKRKAPQKEVIQAEADYDSDTSSSDSDLETGDFASFLSSRPTTGDAKEEFLRK